MSEPGASTAGAAAQPAAGATRVDAGALLRRAAADGTALAGPHLVVREPRGGERVVALCQDRTVGRDASASLRLADPSASRLHLRLTVDGTGASVEDLGSRNGLRLNGRRVRGPRRLRSGDQLEVGESLLRYVDPLQPAAATASGPGRSRPHGETSRLLALAAALLLLAAALLAPP